MVRSLPVFAAALLTPMSLAAQTAPLRVTARDRLVTHLTALAREQTAARARAVAAIATPAQARARQVRVRALLDEMIRFERVAGPVRSEVVRSTSGAGYTVDAVWYESLPGVRVTADLYRPATGAGPFPAIIIQPGHGPDGKLGDHAWAVNLARAGYIVLSIDIVGEGERIQHYDPEIGSSKVGRPTGEHAMLFGQTLPTGGHVSRFFIQDAMRGVDYLTARTDVDDRRIGAFGCSGGGTVTAYLAALDPRIRAIATACYVNDFDHLLSPGGPGPQDAEQSIPFFLERGLDLPDWIELAAPRPYLIVSTTGDMFPIAGARAAFAEARGFYAAMGAADRIAMLEGPGGHGNLQPIAPRLIAWFDRWLKSPPEPPADRPEAALPPPPPVPVGPPPAFTPVPLGDPARLLATRTGQLVTDPDGGVPLRTAIAREAPVPPALPAREGNRARLDRLRLAIREVARTRVAPGGDPPAVTLGTAADGAVPIRFDAAPGLPVDGLWVRTQRSGRRPTLLYLAAPTGATLGPSGLVGRWTAAGWNVLVLEPRGAGGTEEAKSPLTGDWTLLSLRALLVGRTPVGMRIDDALAALAWLRTQPDVAADRLRVHGAGALAPVALHVGVLDPLVRDVVAEGGIIAYRDFTTRPLGRDMAEINLPGVLARYDLPDLMAALGDRLTLVNPVDAVGRQLRSDEIATALPAPGRPSIIVGGPRDPLQIPPR